MNTNVTNPNKTILCIILAAAVILLCGAFCGAAAAGDVSETSPYEISTAAELTSFLTDADGWKGQYGKITADEISVSTEINVIGEASKNLDLNGKTIKAVSGTFTNGLLNWSSSGTLTITDSVGTSDSDKRGSISGNSKTRPLYLDKGTVMMTSGKLTGGRLVLSGGGVFMNSGRFELSGNAGIEDNYVDLGKGGGVYMNSGTFTMKENASIKGNYVDIGNGGGVYMNGGGFTMEGSSSIINSTSNGGGGGVYLNCGTFTMKDNASISGNRQFGNAENGGGVYVGGNGTFTMEGSSSISGNTGKSGGGADIHGKFTMSGNSRISKNSATNGGGVYYNGGGFTMTDNSTIGGDEAKDGNTADNGGGLYIDGGWVSIESANAKIIGNTATTNGGGVYCYTSSGFTLSTGSITQNTANNGGGVYNYAGGGFTLSNSGSISENTAKSSGGGVYSTSRVKITGGSISGNTANVNGGGVFMNGGTFDMSAGTIGGTGAGDGNSATKGDGGGVYIWSAAYAMTGGEIIENSAGGNGGGVYFAGTSYSMTGGSITQNSAAGDGGGVYYDGGGTYLKLTGGTPVINGNTKSDGTTANNLLVTNPAHIRLDKPMMPGTDIRVTSPKPYPTGEFGDSISHYFEDPDRGGAKFIKSDDDGLCGRINDVMNLVWIWNDTETEEVEFN